MTKSFIITLRVLPGYAKKCGVHVAPLMLHIPCECQCGSVTVGASVAHHYYSWCDHLPNTGGYGTGRGHHHSAAFSRPEVAKVACGQFLHGLISHSLVLASANTQDPLTIPWLQKCYLCLCHEICNALIRAFIIHDSSTLLCY